MLRVALLLSLFLAAPASGQSVRAWYQCDAFSCHWFGTVIDRYEDPGDGSLGYLTGRIVLISRLMKPGLITWFEFSVRFWEYVRSEPSIFDEEAPDELFAEDGPPRSGRRKYEIPFQDVDTYQPHVVRIVVSYEDGTTSTWDNLISYPTTTVPEPVSIVLLATGLAAVGVARRRKRRS